MKKILSFCIICVLLGAQLLTTEATKIEQYSQNKYYEVGDRVINNEKMYECIENNGTNQCNFGEDYAPGEGIYWKRTWVLVDDIEENTSSTGSTSTEESTSGVILSEIPGNPRITNQSKTINTGNYTVSWEMAKGENPATSMRLYENSTLVKLVQAKTGDVFTKGSFDITGKKDGKYVYSVYVCNKSGSEKCAKSNTVTITVSGVGKTTSTSTTTTNTTSTTSSSSTNNTSTSSSSSSTSSVKRSDIPTFERLPSNKTFDDFGKALETKLRNEVKTKKLSKQGVKDYISVVDGWIDYLKALNRKGELTGKEKRSLIVIQMMKGILEKLD